MQNGNKLVGVPNCNASVENGILHFETMQDFISYHEFNIKNTMTENLILEKKNNFTSFTSQITEILENYRLMCEDRNKNYSNILEFRELKKSFISISDSDFHLKIEGLFNEIVNPDGYVIIGNQIYKFTDLMVYKTKIENRTLLETNNYSSPLVISNKVIKGNLDSKKTMQIDKGQSKTDKIESHLCPRKRSTSFSFTSYLYIEFSGPPYGNSFWYKYAESGWKFEVFNKQRGRTGIWYSFPINIENIYHLNAYASFGFSSQDNWNNQTYISKLYSINNKYEDDNNGFITNFGPLSPTGVANWANNWYNNIPWENISGTVKADHCQWVSRSY